jgi:Bacterial archaeo-eukaryotic release factor family 11
MFHVDIPSREEFIFLADVRSDACVSIYIETSPIQQKLDTSKITLSNYIKEALQVLKDRDLDKRRLASLEEELYSVLEDPSFWDLHARSLAIYATPDNIRTYRLANKLSSRIEIGNRYFLKPLLRALTFPHSAFILALSVNQVRLIEFFSDKAPVEMNIPDLPSRLKDALGEAALNDHHHGKVHPKVRAAQFTRKIDQVLRPHFLTHNFPLILVSTEPLASIYRTTNTLSNLTDETLYTNAEHLGISELVMLVRPSMDKYYHKQLDMLASRFEQRAGERRVTHDISDAAKAATNGAIELLLVNLESRHSGTINEQGSVSFDESADMETYGLVDEIAKRAIATGAEVLAVRSEDLPPGKDLNAILRYPL